MKGFKRLCPRNGSSPWMKHLTPSVTQWITSKHYRWILGLWWPGRDILTTIVFTLDFSILQPLIHRWQTVNCVMKIVCSKFFVVYFSAISYKSSCIIFFQKLQNHCCNFNCHFDALQLVILLEMSNESAGWYSGSSNYKK